MGLYGYGAETVAVSLVLAAGRSLLTPPASPPLWALFRADVHLCMRLTVASATQLYC